MTRATSAVAILLVLLVSNGVAQDIAAVSGLRQRIADGPWYAIVEGEDYLASYDLLRVEKVAAKKFKVWSRWDFLNDESRDWMTELEVVDCSKTSPSHETIRVVSYKDGSVLSDRTTPVSLRRSEQPSPTSLREQYYQPLCEGLRALGGGLSLVPSFAGIDSMMLTHEEYKRYEDLTLRIDHDRWRVVFLPKKLNSMVSYDKQTIEKAGERRWRTWMRWDNNDEGKPATHSLQRTVVDCGEMNTTMLDYVEYDADGNVTDSTNVEPEKRRTHPVVPDSIGESVYTAFCQAMPKTMPKAAGTTK